MDNVVDGILEECSHEVICITCAEKLKLAEVVACECDDPDCTEFCIQCVVQCPVCREFGEFSTFKSLGLQPNSSTPIAPVELDALD